jgi:hypothetical protein
MALKPYRKHRKECEGGHAEDARTASRGRTTGMEALRRHHPCSRKLSARNSTGGKPVRLIGKEHGLLRMHTKTPDHETAKSLRLRNPFPSSRLTG